MPQPRKYANRAAQQSAYRLRHAEQRVKLMASKGLPLLPAIPAIPGYARWKAMTRSAQVLLVYAANEMQCYYDDRSEQWQESDRAEELLNRIEHLAEVAEQIQDIT